MVKRMSKSGLAIALSKLKVFESPKMRQEQYPTDSEVAALVLWNAYALGDIEGKVIADLGCGTGILGIGSLLLGASKVFFIDIDKDALKIAQSNISKILVDFWDARKHKNLRIFGSRKPMVFVESKIFDISKLESESLDDWMPNSKAEYVCKDIGQIRIKAQVVLENPPFGTKVKHNDRIFLEKAMETADIVYSFHKSESKAFLERFSGGKNFRITHIWAFKFPLKATFSFHRRQMHRIDVSCFRFKRIG